MKSTYSKLVLISANRLLDVLADLPEVPCGMPPESALATQLGISRSTVKKLISLLHEKGVLRLDSPHRIVLRKPVASDYFSDDDTRIHKSDLIEKQVLRKLSTYELKPGDRFSELELAKEFSASTILTREALMKIAQSGIIRKHPHQKWEVIEFSGELIGELAEARMLFEGYALQRIRFLPESDPIWMQLRKLEARHEAILGQPQISSSEIREMEKQFHFTLIETTRNRFIESSYDSLFTLITFHLGQIEYDRAKIERVLNHHLVVLKALLRRDFEGAREAMDTHLEFARDSMNRVNEQLAP